MADIANAENMKATQVQIVRPTIESLTSNIKGRPKSSCKTDMKKVYHCPIKPCKYYEDSSFNKIKFLKQHYVKVHQTKTYSCAKCGKAFALEGMLLRHESICGIQYRCYCNTQFATYEAFLTHAKRKNHANGFLGYKEMMACLKVHTAAQKFQKNSDNLKVRAIIVEESPQQKLLILNKKRANTATSKETQTGMKMCKILPKVSSETQTVSMQTTCITAPNTKRRRRSKVNGISTVASSQSSVSFSTSSTQTTPLKEEKLNKLLPAKQRCKIPNTNEFSSIPAITFEDTSDSSNSPSRFIDNFADPNLASSFSNWNDPNDTEQLPNDVDLVFYSNSETQTAFEDLFDHSCMDTYTQTCDSLFSDMDFVDIQTQTSWSIFDDSMKSRDQDGFSIN
ncbi:uncharacterized protein Asciz [Planococcus citri]|uniref:uncharacterized protein Asciz n=1 Tax=Planococcus citri TaxID=170843 RepID=UPI0031F9AD1F